MYRLERMQLLDSAVNLQISSGEQCAVDGIAGDQGKLMLVQNCQLEVTSDVGLERYSGGLGTADAEVVVGKSTLRVCVQMNDESEAYAPTPEA